MLGLGHRGAHAIHLRRAAFVEGDEPLLTDAMAGKPWHQIEHTDNLDIRHRRQRQNVVELIEVDRGHENSIEPFGAQTLFPVVRAGWVGIDPCVDQQFFTTRRGDMEGAVAHAGDRRVTSDSCHVNLLVIVDCKLQIADCKRNLNQCRPGPCQSRISIHRLRRLHRLEYIICAICGICASFLRLLTTLTWPWVPSGRVCNYARYWLSLKD